MKSSQVASFGVRSFILPHSEDDSSPFESDSSDGDGIRFSFRAELFVKLLCPEGFSQREKCPIDERLTKWLVAFETPVSPALGSASFDNWRDTEKAEQVICPKHMRKVLLQFICAICLPFMACDTRPAHRDSRYETGIREDTAYIDVDRLVVSTDAGSRLHRYLLSSRHWHVTRINTPTGSKLVAYPRRILGEAWGFLSPSKYESISLDDWWDFRIQIDYQSNSQPAFIIQRYFCSSCGGAARGPAESTFHTFTKRFKDESADILSYTGGDILPFDINLLPKDSVRIVEDPPTAVEFQTIGADGCGVAPHLALGFINEQQPGMLCLQISGPEMKMGPHECGNLSGGKNVVFPGWAEDPRRQFFFGTGIVIPGPGDGEAYPHQHIAALWFYPDKGEPRLLSSRKFGPCT